jgi:hypothetical protein
VIPTKSIARMELESIYETIDNAVIVPKDVILVSMSFFSKGYMLIGPQLYLYLTQQVAVTITLIAGLSRMVEI